MTDWDIAGRVQRRRFSRRPVELPVRLRFGGRVVAATIENISPGGAFLRVALPESASEVVASIPLPHGKNLRVRARVRWRRAGKAPGVGVEFDSFLEKDFSPHA